MKTILIISLTFFSLLLAEIQEVRPYRIINADKVISTRENSDEYITNLTGDVHFFYGETEFYADLAQIFEKREIVLLEGNVQVYDDTLSLYARNVKYIKHDEHLILRDSVLVKEAHSDSTMRTFEADLVNYYREKEELYADNNVRMFDDRESISGYCGKLAYFMDKNYGYLMKSPRLYMQKDDTLMVAGEKIEYFDDYKKIISTFDVITKSSEFKVTSDFLIYYSEDEKAIYQGNPQLESDFATASAQEFQLFFNENKPEKAVLQDSCIVFFKTAESGEKTNWVSSSQMEFQFFEGNISFCDARMGVESHFVQENINEREYILNDAVGDKMKIFFNEVNEIKSIDFIGNVKGKYKFQQK